jgi:hypothetical protein
MRIPSQSLSALKPAPAADGPVSELGTVPWTRADAVAALEAFLPVYDRRPIQDNQGGMRSVGLFNVWFLITRLAPKAVLESGIWKGQSTWLIEQAAPGAAILSIDINLALRQYVSPRVRYTQTDFLVLDPASMGWSPEGALAFFDDHQDVLPRLRKSRALGIRDVILDDNYPEFKGARHLSAAAILNDRNEDGSVRFAEERRELLGMLDAYYVCKPVFDYGQPLTMEKSYIREPSLLGPFDAARHAGYAAYERDLPEYRWTTYLRLK